MPKKKDEKKENNSLPVHQRDGRYLRRTNRTVHFATKVTSEFDQLIREQAHQQKCLITEMLEKYQQAYLKLESQQTKKNHAKKQKS